MSWIHTFQEVFLPDEQAPARDPLPKPVTYMGSVLVISAVISIPWLMLYLPWLANQAVSGGRLFTISHLYCVFFVLAALFQFVMGVGAFRLASWSYKGGITALIVTVVSWEAVLAIGGWVNYHIHDGVGLKEFASRYGGALSVETHLLGPFAGWTLPLLGYLIYQLPLPEAHNMFFEEIV